MIPGDIESKPTVVSSAVVAENRWTRIIQQQIAFPNGKPGEYLIVDREPALMIIPLVHIEGIAYTYLVRQYRHPIGRSVWQFPMGSLEKGKLSEDHAKQELEEETGVIAISLRFMCQFFVDPGLSKQVCHVYIAEGVIEGGQQQLEETEADLVARRIRVTDLENMIKYGDIVDSWGLSGLYWLMKYLDENHQIEKD